MNLIEIAESGWIPDSLIRVGIRQLLSRRLREVESSGVSLESFAAEMRKEPLAIATDSANEQHYEVPTAFYEQVLGKRKKYSGCLYESESTTLDQAEEAMLQLTCSRAEIADGMRVLELGCGWGSLTLWMAEKFPGCQITAVSNSATQKQHIDQQAESRGLTNVRTITADMRVFEPQEQFDRIVSVEMFEHLRNYELLLERLSGWLHPDGKVFAHVFCNKRFAYYFEDEGSGDWMARNFFTGGMMPAVGLFQQFDNDMKVESQWSVNGVHYYRTCEHWLENLDENRRQALAVLRQDLPEREARLHLQRWRIFFMACGELFRYRGGSEWFVLHTLFQRQNSASMRDSQPQLVSSL